MMKKIGAIARALYILLAIIAGFVALNMLNVPLVLVVLGLIGGLAMDRANLVGAGVIALVLPTVGAALANIPTIGAQLAAVCGNLQIGIAGALATAIAMLLYDLTTEGVMGVKGGEGVGGVAATAR